MDLIEHHDAVRAHKERREGEQGERNNSLHGSMGWKVP
jgi:hypothetical protein